MVNEKIDKRKKPTRRVTCPDCGTDYAVTSFKLHRCVSHDRQQWIKVEGNTDRYEQVLKGTVERDMTVEEQLKQNPQTGTTQFDKTLDEQTKDQEHITKVKLTPEEDIMPETETETKSKEHEYKYECGECHHQFDDKLNFCPSCGVSFE